ncbi:MAG: stage III sporulation protein AD [Sporomusaceae bacterium]|nr:stage III sporulation protein AD [Sporomusaceae bacterium]
MDIVQIVAIGFIATLLSLLIKGDRPEFALQLSLALTALIFLFVLGKLSVILNVFQDLAHRANLDPLYLGLILKIIGIAYITEFGAQICRDANEGAIAGKIEFAGKVLVMVMAVPVLALVLDTITKLLP